MEDKDARYKGGSAKSAAFLVVGCSKNDLSKNDQPGQPAAVAADNSGRNVRDRDDATI
jgi:hypothetical protein